MEKIIKRISERVYLSSALKLYSHAVTLLSVAIFVYLLFEAYRASVLSLVKIVLILAIPFLLVSALRRIINAPRPYELYSIFDGAPKKKQGSSFPSRHAYSAFAISVAAIFVNPALGCVMLALSLGMCIARVLLGIHFIRDVAAGALCGTAASVIGILITNPF